MVVDMRLGKEVARRAGHRFLGARGSGCELGGRRLRSEREGVPDTKRSPRSLRPRWLCIMMMAVLCVASSAVGHGGGVQVARAGLCLARTVEAAFARGVGCVVPDEDRIARGFAGLQRGDAWDRRGSERGASDRAREEDAHCP
eukprot:3932395-Rhodomonas_salina.2